MKTTINKVAILERLKIANNFTKDSELSTYLGISPSTLSNWIKRKTLNYDLIFSKCEQINAEWLLTGNGEMLKNEKNLTEKSPDVEVSPLSYPKYNEKIIDRQRIPLFGHAATAGVVPVFTDLLNETPEDYITIPRAPKCDGALYVTGDSMYPLLKSGDIIMFKAINDIISNIFYGEMYLLSLSHNGDEYVTVKYIQKSDREGYIKLVSQNQHHQDVEFPISSIRSLALVKASIRFNAMQ